MDPYYAQQQQQQQQPYAAAYPPAAYSPATTSSYPSFPVSSSFYQPQPSYYASAPSAAPTPGWSFPMATTSLPAYDPYAAYPATTPPSSVPTSTRPALQHYASAPSLTTVARVEVLMGPVLLFRGLRTSDGSYQVAALLATKGQAPTLTIKSHPSTHVSVIGLKSVKWRDKDINHGYIGKDQKKKSGVRQMAYLWRYDWGIPQTDRPQVVQYTVSEWPSETFWYEIPAFGVIPRCCFVSCNGFHSTEDRLRYPASRVGECWRRINERHWANPLHLLIQGGDQIYADQVFKRVKELNAWKPPNPFRGDGRLAQPFPDKLRAKVDSCYFKMYIEHWTESQQRRTFAHIPSVMMWDDHDIFDGWGSYDAKYLKSPTWNGIYEMARDNFMAFQLGIRRDMPLPEYFIPGQAWGLSYAFQVGGLIILALDLRSERTLQHIMHPQSYTAVYNYLHRVAETNNSGVVSRCTHMYLVSSVPVMYNNLDIAEKALSLLPWQHELMDDLRDHWRSPGHLQERKSLVDQLLTFAYGCSVRVTILSGDVHLAALGVFLRNFPNTNTGCIFQLISSAVMNVPPPTALIVALESMGVGKSRELLDSTTVGKMLRFPGSTKSHLGTRNFLLLIPSTPTSAPTGQGWVDAHWESEKNDHFSLRIHDPGARSPEIGFAD